jgi:polyketide biosynthesis enoyl-CoA hydratase PksI
MNPPSKVLSLEWLDGCIAVVAMEDRASKNRFTPELIAGLSSAFEEINQNQNAKAVMIHGYDQYFCCGGTEAELIELAERKVEFTSFAFYDLLLKCPLPVVAAMQGHAIGGGLVFGAYADVMVLAKECIYNTNFMEYGFTPGLGATFIIPKKFGTVLGWEMLFSAKSYHGGELQERGAPMLFTSRAEVVRTALGLARELAGKRIEALKEMKQCMIETFRRDLDKALQKELAMHKKMFADPSVRERIVARYGQ